MLSLALSGGGARAAYQVGVLAEIARRAPALRFPILTGVSAGAINAAFLAGHRGPLPDAVQGLGGAWRGLAAEPMFRSDTLSLAGSAVRWILSLGTGMGDAPSRFESILDTAPLREYLTKVIDFDGIEANVQAGRLQALALTAARYSTGESITFVASAPDLPLWERSMRRAVRSKISIEHVMASSALPVVFPAVEIEGEFYGDGAVRHATPLSPSCHLGADRILAIVGQAAAAPGPSMAGYPSTAYVVVQLLDSIFIDALDADAERMERINRLLDLLPPDFLPVWGLRPIDLSVFRPSRDLGELAASYADRLPRAFRLLLRGLGGHRTLSADLLSYLMFEEPYIQELFELGARDAGERWDELGGFLGVRESLG